VGFHFRGYRYRAAKWAFVFLKACWKGIFLKPFNGDFISKLSRLFIFCFSRSGNFPDLWFFAFRDQKTFLLFRFLPLAIRKLSPFFAFLFLKNNLAFGAPLLLI
jgi:hypothetical protein